ncbi:MAG TPA: hypothetical protein VGZ22_18595 [Isosphaeraceae bacterium]|jgi:hypothetical protein|nr:hypothetical protein [Isosphaeraceae bacterium]
MDEFNVPAVRRFTLLDATVLIAATAVGLAMALQNNEPLRRDLQFVEVMLRAGYLDFLTPWRTMGLVLDFTSVLVTWTLALLALRLLPPRPANRELFRQPGIVACFTASIPSVPIILLSVFLSPSHEANPIGLNYFLLPVVGVFVAVNLVALALVGGWRHERSWIDRCGLLAGLAWVGLIPLNLWLRWL